MGRDGSQLKVNKNTFIIKNMSGFYVTETLAFKPFHATGLFLFPPENIRKPEVFRRYRKNSGLKWVSVKRPSC